MRIRWSLAMVGLVVLATAVLRFLEVASAPLFAGLLSGLLVGLRAPGVVRIPWPGFRLAQGIIGVTTGAMVEWSRLAKLGWSWPAVVGVCVITLLLSIAAGQLLTRHGVSRATATFASVAGGASGMTAIASDFDADDRA